MTYTSTFRVEANRLLNGRAWRRANVAFNPTSCWFPVWLNWDPNYYYYGLEIVIFIRFLKCLKLKHADPNLIPFCFLWRHGDTAEIPPEFRFSMFQFWNLPNSCFGIPRLNCINIYIYIYILRSFTSNKSQVCVDLDTVFFWDNHR